MLELWKLSLRDFAIRHVCARNMQSTSAHGEGDTPSPEDSVVLRILAEFLSPARRSGAGRREQPPTWEARTVHVSRHFWEWPQSKSGSGHRLRLSHLQGTLSLCGSFSRVGLAWEELKIFCRECVHLE